jgi:gliding motility-associated protein GldL
MMTDENRNDSFMHRAQNCLSSYSGKVFLNICYSLGAAVVILGALFKLTHLPAANLMLYVGMGTEVFVFLISAFDKPTKTYKWESVFPNLKIQGKKNKSEEDEDLQDTVNTLTEAIQQNVSSVRQVVNAGNQPVYSDQLQSPAPFPSVPLEQPAASIPQPLAPTVTPEMEDATKDYLEQLRSMTASLSTFTEQLSAISGQSQEMDVLNRNLAGINAVYELQLKSASLQMGTVDRVHQETEKMAGQIEELNRVYARMLQAMTANMSNQQPIK